MDEQLEFDLPPEDCLIVEDLTDSPNKVLISMLNRCSRVMVIGVDEDGLMFSISENDPYFWNYALDRAKKFIHNRMDG